MQEEVHLSGGISLRLPSQKPKPEKVTPAQWIAANSRIMTRLLESGQLTGRGALEYLTYTAKVGEMAARYTWSSVMIYDDQYRQNQAAEAYKWGSDSQHLALVALRERGPTPPQRRRQPPAHTDTSGHHLGPRRVMASSGREVCHQWNKGHCRYAPRCQFEHVCSVCLQRDHPAVSHSFTQPPAPVGDQNPVSR